MSELDYRAFFESVPGCTVVLDRALCVVAVSDDFLEAAGASRGDLLGQPRLDELPERLFATGLLSHRVVLEEVVRQGRRHVAAADTAAERPPLRPGDRCWRATIQPLLDARGEVAYLVHHAEEITRLVQLERLCREEEASLRELSLRTERYMQLLDTAPDATVIVGEDSRIQMVNRQTEQMFGYARDELIGHALEVLIPERFRAMHVLHMRRYFDNPGARPMGSGLLLLGRRKDGSELPIEVSLSPQQGAQGFTVSAAIRDISERRRLEEAARTMSDRLAGAVESIQDAFALFDAEDRLVLCNSVYMRLFHDVVPGPLIGKTLGELLSGWSHEISFSERGARESFVEARLAVRRHERTASFDVRLKDGRTLRVTQRRMADGGMVKTIWDLSEEEARAEELRQARATAEAASAAKSEFLASMSHELRTPLNAVLGFAQLLVRDKKDPLSQRHVERAGYILQGGEHLLRLIDDVLDLARIEAGRVSISTEPVHVGEVLDEVRRTLGPIAERYGVGLFTPPVDESLPHVLADRTRYTQILLNFGTNAAKYNRPGGRVVFAVTVVEHERLRVTITDNGLGIPRDKQDKLFQPFQRAGQEAGSIEGTGIGLSITKRLAEMMGGSVGFDSIDGKGSSFWVDMPVEPASARSRLPALDPAPDASALAPSNAKVRLVLYVEDNPANVSFMRDVMSSFEHIDLVTVPTAELGIEFARARQPTAILMDINLPGMSGVDALRALRALPETAHIPIIALTAAASERDRLRGIEAGFFRYLTKPVRVDELMSALELLLEP